MFKNWFKAQEKALEPKIAVASEPMVFATTTVLTVEEDRKKPKNIVEKIHNEFYTEIERLLVEANVELPEESVRLAEKSKALSSLGFSSAPETQAGLEIARRRDNNNQLIEVSKHFSMRYPTYKLITKESVTRICKTYGLVRADVNRYKGLVPDKNLQDILRFKVKNEDCVWYSTSGYSNKYSDWNIVDYSEKDLSKGKIERGPLQIVAPIKDLDTTGMRVEAETLKMEIKDPVVLHPVRFNKVTYYLIVTAWGPEASDPEVINPKSN